MRRANEGVMRARRANEGVARLANEGVARLANEGVTRDSTVRIAPYAGGSTVAYFLLSEWGAL